MTKPVDPASPQGPPGSGRSRRALRDYPGVFWMVVAFVVALIHRSVPEATWLLVHLVLLGALTHAIVVWSEHFAQALLKTPASDGARKAQDRRILLLEAGALLVLVGVPTALWWVTLAGVLVVSTAVAWHAGHLLHDLRRALPLRFRGTLHYYLAASACLVVGAGLGATLAWGLDDEWEGRVLIAHTMVNLLGWVGLTVTGTLVTLWPTMLRTRMDPRGDRLARQALPIFAIALVVLPTGALLGLRWVAVSGLVLYVAALLWWGRALILPTRAKPPREFSTASVGAALGWAAVGLAWVGVLLASAMEWAGVADRFAPIAAVFAGAFALQLLTGALSYLVPSVLGGGPAAVRAGQAWLNKGTTVRLVLINGGLLLWLAPTPSWVKVIASAVALVAAGAFVPLLLASIRASVRARGAVVPVPTGPITGSAHQPKVWSAGQLIAGLTVLSLAVTAGVAIDPAAAGLTGASPGAASSVAVAPNGHTTTVKVVATGMTFSPNSVTVPAGEHVVIELVNEDPSTTHDLLVGDKKTPRLNPGRTATLDLGVVGATIQGWCTVVGHRQMGMTFDVLVDGTSTSPTTGASGAMTHAGVTAVPGASLGRTVDPVLAPLTAERVHRITLTVTEVPLEVAPGIWQTRWTYNGGPVGPTLHGRIGDTFVVTLVNNGSMGHSVDFHAGEVAPDGVMKTIPPGASLEYTFTAKRAGVWMYHCSTMPMSAHIAAGMHGAVIIEPDGLPAVDRSYVLVQSEVFLSSAARTAEEATEVNGDNVTAQLPDFVTFNGEASQYDQKPFAAKVGERVRFWVLDAGPNRPSSFHIVGGQFDTVYREGAYLLKGGRDAFGGTGGGSQVLALGPAEGGFVELTFPEAGHYPVVSHLMVDAERGAHGIVEVTG